MTPTSEKFLADIRNDNAEVRYAAWSRAGDLDPEVIPQLGKLLTTGKPGVRKAAGEALKNVVHSAGKEPGGVRRAAVVRQLIALTADAFPESRDACLAAGMDGFVTKPLDRERLLPALARFAARAA